MEVTILTLASHRLCACRNSLFLFLFQLSTLAHSLEIFIWGLQRGWQGLNKAFFIHPIQTVLENVCSTMMSAFSASERSMKSGALIGTIIDGTVQDVVVIEDSLASLQMNLKLAGHVTTQRIIDGNISFFRSSNPMV